jgi:hypothetical protein
MLINQEGVGKSEHSLLPTPVVVRGYQGEPVRMEAVTLGPRFATVRRPGGGSVTARFSYDIVYEFELSQYRRLVNAFTSGDGQALERLWKVTPRIK